MSRLSNFQWAARAAGVSANQVALVRRTVARACTDTEFQEFMAVATSSALDPMRRQIQPLILHGDDLARRRMIPWTTIDGLRATAARHGDYRPMETPPILECDESRIDAQRNPLGIVRAEVTAWKCRDQTWFPVCGEAWWDEHAPLREEWAADETGVRKPTGQFVLERSWARMGRLMLAKCAEAQALRRGWPNALSGLYGEEELHALEAAKAEEEGAAAKTDKAAERAFEPASEPALWFSFASGSVVESVPRSKVKDRVWAFLAEASVDTVADFLVRNRESLGVFWDWEPGSAFELKRLAEYRIEMGARAEAVQP